MKAECYLIIAADARCIVESAKRADYAIVTIDGFADQDLQALTEQSVRVSLRDGILDADSLLAAFRELRTGYPLTGIIAGSGLENQADICRYISREVPWFNNKPETFALCGQRMRIAEILAELDIPTLIDSTDKFADFPKLGKYSHTSGGGHIQWAGRNTAADVSEVYLPGISVSHLFLANTNDIMSVGFNTQWHSRHDPTRPFCYGGAINRNVLDSEMRQMMETYARWITCRLGLRGLNNIDYLLCADKLYCLEINPRPSASMQINEGSFTYAAGDTRDGLFAAHIQACDGELPVSSTVYDDLPTAYAIIYARRSLRISEQFQWPSGTKDLPAVGEMLVPGQPLCTLAAAAREVSETLTQLQNKMSLLDQQLNSG